MDNKDIAETIESCCDGPVQKECSDFFGKMKDICSSDSERCSEMITVLEKCYCCC